MSQLGLVAWCPRCRDYVPADTFAGLTAYKRHAREGVTACANSNKPTPYKAKQSFAGHIQGQGNG